MIFVDRMYVLVSRSMNIVTFPTWVVDFLREKVTTTTANPGNRRGFCVEMREVGTQKEQRIVRATLAETTGEDKFNTWMTRKHSFP